MTSMRCVGPLAVLLLACVVRLAVAADIGFPFSSELTLEGESSRVHKRLPMIQVDEDGSATLDLWFGSVRTQASPTAASRLRPACATMPAATWNASPATISTI